MWMFSDVTTEKQSGLSAAQLAPGARQMMTAESSSFIDYLLAEIECGIVRAKLWQNDLAAIGIALRAGLVDVDNALDHLAGCGALRLIALSSDAITSVSTS
jgi:hypothetical protein